jgi:hypothetical protein
MRQGWLSYMWSTEMLHKRIFAPMPPALNQTFLTTCQPSRRRLCQDPSLAFLSMHLYLPCSLHHLSFIRQGLLVVPGSIKFNVSILDSLVTPKVTAWPDNGSGSPCGRRTEDIHNRMLESLELLELPLDGNRRAAPKDSEGR